MPDDNENIDDSARAGEAPADLPLVAALQYAAAGLSVIPIWECDSDGRCGCGKADCSSPGKHPLSRLVPHGLKDATMDRDVIKGWWLQAPAANVAIVTGPISGLVVLDVDPRNGGMQSLRSLVKEHGKITRAVQQATGGGGTHTFFKHPGGSVPCRQGLWPGIDVKADGGYVVVAPSRHVSGKRYAFVSGPDFTKLPSMPDWLLAAIKRGNLDNASKHAADDHDDRIPAGKRNNDLSKRAFKLRDAGLDEEAVFAQLLLLNDQLCDPPLDTDEVAKIAKSASRSTSKRTRDPARHLKLNRASSYEPQSVSWVWRDWLPQGKVVLVCGMPGLGKTSAVLDIAARVTRGAWMPDGSQGIAGQVLFFSAEDDASDTIVPRLIAAGADLDRVHIEEGMIGDDGLVTSFNLRDHLVQFEDRVKEHSPVVVIFDPLSAYVGDTDTHRESDVRQLLRPLADLAAKYEFCAVGIAHLNKATDVAALHRVAASVGFVAAARGVLGVVRDPDAPEQSVLGVMKSNLGPLPTALGLRVEEVVVKEYWEGDLNPYDPATCVRIDIAPVKTSRVKWLGERPNVDVSETVETRAEPASKLAEACEFLKVELQGGQRPQKYLKDSAKDAGHAWATVQRAKTKLGVRSRMIQTTTPPEWVWELPPPP